MVWQVASSTASRRRSPAHVDIVSVVHQPLFGRTAHLLGHCLDRRRCSSVGNGDAEGEVVVPHSVAGETHGD